MSSPRIEIDILNTFAPIIFANIIFSNGVGRTGACLAIDHEFKRSRKEGVIDLLQYAMTMRTDRAMMIETIVGI